MPLGTPSTTVLNGGDLRSPSTPTSRGSSSSGSSGSSGAGGRSLMSQYGTQATRNNGIGPVAPGVPVDSSHPYTTFQSTPEWSNQGAWSGWGGSAPTTGDAADRALQGIYGGLTGGWVGRGSMSVEDYYRAQYGDDLVEQAKRSGLDPQVFFGLGSAAQEQAAQWGTNLPNANDIIGQQRSAFDSNYNRQMENNAFIDEFGALQDYQQDNLLSQYTQGVGMAQGRYDLGIDQLEQGYHTDRGILGQQRHRAIDIGRDDNAAALLHNANMRGVLDTRRGLIGTEFDDRQGYLNEQIGFLNDRQDLAYNRFQSDDAYAAGQAQDLMAQYGFAGRQFAQTQEGLFADRATSTRAASSDAAARGAFGSAGFGDNVQDIYGQYSRGMDANTLQLDRTNEAIDVRNTEIGKGREDLRFGYEGQQIGFNQDAAGLDYQHATNITNTEGAYNTLTGQYSANDKERSQLQNVDRGLESLAKEYGLRQQDIKNQFDNAVTRMGLDLNDTTQQLEQMLSSGNAALQAQGMQFMQQFMSYQ